MRKLYFSFLTVLLFVASVNRLSAQCTPSAPQTFTNNTPVAILDNTTVTSTITVVGASTYLYNLKMITNITHTFAGDLDITITSPTGTVVTLTTDNGGGNDDVFAGTTWDDKAGATNAPGAVTDNVFANLVVETPLAPEEPLGAFIGENPNGVWTISVTDDAGGDIGSLASWSLVVQGLSAAPTTLSATYSNNTPVAIVDNTTVTSTITVAGAGSQIFDVNMLTNITHTFAGDLDITITSPSGTVVTLTTDNGGGNDDVFAGTVWDDKAGATNPPGPVTDNVFANLVLETPLSPEEPLAAFIGENPNGIWTITITDDAGGDVGTLSNWSLTIVTSNCSGGSSPCVPGAAQTFTNNTPVAILDNSTVTSTIAVAGAPTYLYNLKMITNITHTFAGDLDITITSPSGTVVTLTTDNGGGNDNVFAGTTWDDKAGAANPPGSVTDNVFANLVVETPLAPEEPLGAFIGENPNGVWTITVTDDAGGDVGSLASWSLVMQGLSAAPTTVSGTYSNNTPVAIVDNSTVTSTITVAGAGTQIFDVNMLTNITHTFAGDLDITIASPSGTVVTLTTDNGGGNDNVFAGTLWDDNAGATNPPGAVTDNVFANLVLETPLAPEEPLAAFIGENPNGVWTISVTDDAGGDVGSLASWSLDIKTSLCGGALAPCLPGGPQTFTNNTPLAIPTGPAVVSNTIAVAGAPVYLADLNIITNLTHTFAADLDITITSPAGTVVTLTSDNGAGNDNVFNGTTWDDDANPAGTVPYLTNNGLATDHAYANLVTATPLAPEEALGAFIGEDPNGVWTFTISDDLGGDGGSLDSWSLVIRGFPAAPTIATTAATNNTPVAIPAGPAVVSSTINIAGAGTQLADLNLATFITHTFAGDLDITLTSPAGTVVTLTTDNGGSNDDVFNGTIWDDDANPAGQVPYGTNNGLVGDHAYVNLTTATPLAPEEGLAAFIGENPNGTWTLTISDDAGGDAGSLNSWSLDIKTSLCPGVVCNISHSSTGFNVTNACSLGTVTVTGTAINGGPGNYTHTLSGPGTITPNAPTGPNNSTGNFTVTNVPAGTHTYVLTSTAANGCPVSSNITGVVIKPTPVVTFTPAAPVICNGAIQQITANVVPPALLPSFSQFNTIVVPAGSPITTQGIAAPYSSDITVAGLPATGVSVKSVKLGNFNHTFPDDVDVVLVSPTGQAVILMSDVGGGTDVVGLDYTLDDAAASLMSDGGFNAQGTYRPTNMEPGDVWTAPAPPSPSATTLSTFTGNFNGNWRLFVMDDATGDVGFIGNWTINFSIPSLVVFSPITGLYTDPAATIPYTGTPTTVVYAKPATTTVYTGTSTVDGCTGSGTVTVTVNQLPTITVQPTPATQTICPGFNVNYSVTATGAGLTYQWRRNGVNLVNGGQISGATTNALSITGVTTANAGNYDVVVSGTCPPPAVSNTVVLNVATTPIISTQPANRTVCVGQTASFSVATVGSIPPPTIYQWQQSIDNGANWTNLTTGGSYTDTYTTPPTTIAMNNYRYRVIVTNFCGQTITTNGLATLTVNALPTVTATALASRICISDTLIPLSGSPVGGSWSGIGVSGFNFVPTATAVGTYNLTYTYTNAAGCTATATVVAKVEDCQERLRLLSDDGVILFPNPNNGRFNIRINSTLYNYLGMKVYNAQGQLLNGKIVNDVLVSPVYTGLVYGRVIPIDLSKLPAGVYMVKFFYDDGIRTSEKTFKVIIAGR